VRGTANVRFGSKADICAATSHVRFTPNSDRESGLGQTVMSALPPKADMCGATRDVRFGPIADIRGIVILVTFLRGSPQQPSQSQQRPQSSTLAALRLYQEPSRSFAFRLFDHLVGAREY